MGQNQRPQHPHQRGVHGHIALGRQRQGQGRAGAGGEGVSRHHHQGPVPTRRQAHLSSRAPKFSHPRRVGSSYLLSGLVKCEDVQDAANRPVRQERPVFLLRLPVEHQARQGRLRYAYAQRPPIRGTGRRQDPLQRPHEGQHP